MSIIITNSALETKKLAKNFAKKILKKSKKKAVVIALKGDLGGGKTTFVQGLANGLGIKNKILSPTFLIMKKIKIPISRSSFDHLIHFDCYRIQKLKEMKNINFKKIISNPRNIVVIEWAERIKKILPKDIVSIYFRFVGKRKRKIIIKNGSKRKKNSYT